jgi:hypothetical protein
MSAIKFNQSYYENIILPLIIKGHTFKNMYDLKLITCSPPTAKKLTYLYGSIEIQEKSVENKRKGKAHGLTKGKPSKLKGRKYEDFLAPDVAERKKAQASKLWKENNPRKYFTNNNISKGQRLLYETIKESFPSAVIEYPIKAVGKTYYLDIAIPELKLNFEYDGVYWHSFPDAIERDRVRDEYLKSLGWKVFRFSFNAGNDLEVREELHKLNINFKEYEQDKSK